MTRFLLMVTILLLAVGITGGCARKTPEEKLREAADAFQKRDVLGAVVLANELLRENTTGPVALQARRLLVNCYAMDSNFRECRNKLDEIITQVGLNDPVGQEAAQMRIGTFAAQRQTTAALEQTVSFLQVIKPSTPFWSTLMFARADFLRAGNQVTSSQKVLAQILQNKELAERDRALALERLDDSYATPTLAAAGISFLEKYVADDPTTSILPDAYRIMGHLASILKDKAREETFYQKCFDAFQQLYDKANGAENKVVILQRYAQAYSGKDETEKAIALLQKALKEFPTVPNRLSLFYQMGGIYFTHAQYDKAIEAYRQIPSEFPTDPRRAEAYFFMAECHARMKKYDAAIADCKEAAALFPEPQIAQRAAYGIRRIEAVRRQEAETSATLAAAKTTSGTLAATTGTAVLPKPMVTPGQPAPSPKAAATTATTPATK